jgi:hypothetical protein
MVVTAMPSPLAPPAAYAGPERRRHRSLVTRRHEYHLRDDRCVAVRDRRSGAWLRGHLAEGLVLATSPALGAAARFVAASCPLATGAVLAITRPPRDLIAHYPLR